MKTAQPSDVPRPQSAQALEDILATARLDASPAAHGLVELCKSVEGAARARELLRELMRAFGYCAFGLSADLDEERQKIRAVHQGHAGLLWLVRIHEEQIPLTDLNAALSKDPARLESCNARLAAWLGA